MLAFQRSFVSVIMSNRADRLLRAKLLKETERLPLRFFAKSTVEVAQNLVGCVLLHNATAGMIVETEAYLGKDDLAAHASKGVTARTEVIFGPPGRAYVYFSYGMHECLNIVAEPEGTPGCVLIRALEPLCGVKEMYERRNWHGNAIGLANGPGKLTQALAITRQQYGARVDRGPLTVRAWRVKPDFDLQTTTRIGISVCQDWPLRFLWAGNPHVSRR